MTAASVRPLFRWVIVASSTWAVTTHHSVAHAQSDPDAVDVSATLNVVGQTTSEDSVRSELVASLDLFTDVRLGPVVVHLYVEGNTTPRTRAVSRRIPFANMDAGTALGSDGNGRVQLSELRLGWRVHDRAVLHAGLMDLTGFLDVSRIANDENLFFLGQPFVNNPTIVFPDYTLGTALLVGIPDVPNGQIALAAAASHGIADTPEASYSQLFDIDAPDRGAFLAGRFRWEGELWEGAVGGWTSSGRRTADLSLRPLPDVGLFSVVGASMGPHSLNARLGVATGDEGSETFLGLTYLSTIGENAVGFGAARAPALPSRVGRHGGHLEAFLRRRVAELVYVTSSIQRIEESLLPDGLVQEGIWIFGLRVSGTL